METKENGKKIHEKHYRKRRVKEKTPKKRSLCNVDFLVIWLWLSLAQYCATCSQCATYFFFLVWIILVCFRLLRFFTDILPGVSMVVLFVFLSSYST